jgi:hypothetical protein
MARRKTATVNERVNARLDEETRHKVEYIKQRTRNGVSEIIVASLDLYYRTLKKSELSAAEILRSSGFVGCGTGPEDLSENYKQHLTRSLAKKA